MSHSALVVEDSPTMRQLIGYALSRVAELEVVEANDGAEALEQLAHHPFDIILTDINMPVMDGFTLIRRIRADANLKEIPIVVITSEGVSDKARAMTLGANAYITKPIQAQQILATVKSLLKIA